MGLLGGIRNKVKVAFSNSIETGKFVRRHRLVRDPEIPGRYWLTGAKDRYIDADLSDPAVRESAELTIGNFKTTITVRKRQPEKEKRAESNPVVKIDPLKIDFKIKR